MSRVVDEDIKPEFYKIIHPSLMTTQHLRIPQDFMEHFTEDDHGTASLKGPSGCKWRVEFSKTEDGTFLQNGWQYFIRDHSLGNHEFLVFRYDGNMKFHVQIFDKTGCEKPESFFVEPAAATSTPETMPPIVVPNRIRRGRPPKYAPHVPGVRDRVPKRSIVPTAAARHKVWDTATEFTSNLHRPYFMRRLTPSTVYTSYVLTLPTKFGKKYFPDHKTEMVLEIPKGKAYAVQYIPAKNCTVCGGWSMFVVDNELEAGDVCVFELVAELRMRVHLFHC